MKTILKLAVLSLCGCVSVGYHKRKLIENRQKAYAQTMNWAKNVRDGDLNIYEFIQLLKEQRFSKRI